MVHRQVKIESNQWIILSPLSCYFQCDTCRYSHLHKQRSIHKMSISKMCVECVRDVTKCNFDIFIQSYILWLCARIHHVPHFPAFLFILLMCQYTQTHTSLFIAIELRYNMFGILFGNILYKFCYWAGTPYFTFYFFSMFTCLPIFHYNIFSC